MTRIISFAGFKGGVGKTTTAFHLASCLADKGTTLLVDSDDNRSALAWSDRTESPTFATVPTSRASKKLMEMTPKWVVIDTKARPNPEDFRDIAEGCDLLIIPTSPKPMDLDVMLKTVEEVQRTGGTYRVLLTLFPPTARQREQEVKATLNEVGIQCFDTVVSRYTFIENLPMLGGVCRDSEDKNAAKAWGAITSLAAEIMTVIGGEANG